MVGLFTSMWVPPLKTVVLQCSSNVLEVVMTMKGWKTVGELAAEHNVIICFNIITRG